MLAGSLAEFTVEDVLRLLARTHATGTLRVNGRAAGLVHCAEGAVTFASAAGDKEMGPMLIRAGFLTSEEWSAVLADDVPTRGLTKAVARRGIGSERLGSFATRQIEESVFELTRWDDGDFLFEPGGGHRLGDAFTCEVPVLMNAIEDRRERWRSLSAVIPSVDFVVRPVPAFPDDDSEVVVTRGQWRVLRAVDGRASVADVARSVGQGIFHTCEAIAALVTVGLVELCAPAASPAAPAAPESAASAASAADPLQGLLAALSDVDAPAAIGQPRS
jgi:uncharacterized protein DUF4388